MYADVLMLSHRTTIKESERKSTLGEVKEHIIGFSLMLSHGTIIKRNRTKVNSWRSRGTCNRFYCGPPFSIRLVGSPGKGGSKITHCRLRHCRHHCCYHSRYHSRYHSLHHRRRHQSLHQRLHQHCQQRRHRIVTGFLSLINILFVLSLSFFFLRPSRFSIIRFS